MTVEDLIEDAWAAIDRGDIAVASDRATRAIDMDPHALEAHLVVSQCLASPFMRIAVLKEAVAIGHRSYRAELKKPKAHPFWSDHDTRPYMRCVHELAIALWDRDVEGDRNDAVDLARHLLRINDSDNQGARFLLWLWLPALERWDELRQILREYGGERRCETAFTEALCAIRHGKNGADRLLATAIQTNEHVAPMLLALHPPVDPMTDTVEWKSPVEAATYANRAHRAWQTVPGAIEKLSTAVRRVRGDVNAKPMPDARHLRTTTRDALHALHSGMVGVQYPTERMTPRPSGISRILMRGPIVEEVDGVTRLIDFDDAAREEFEKRSRRGGYGDAVGIDLTNRGLATTIPMVDTPYMAFVLTEEGRRMAEVAWGRPVVDLLVAVGDDYAVRWDRR